MRLLFFSLVIVILLSQQVHSQDGDGNELDEGDRPKSCYKYNFDLIFSVIRDLTKCLAIFKPNHFNEYSTRFYCILKCLLQQLGGGLIGPDGRFDEIKVAIYFEEAFPTEVQQSLLPKVQGCFAYFEDIDPKDYWCKSYSGTINCMTKLIIADLVPYLINCFSGPVIATVLDAFRNIAPDPIIQADIDELRRKLKTPKKIKCFNRDCSQMYKIEKGNGTKTVVLYDKNMTVISRSTRLNRPTNVIET